ncbi:dienelactone hydrolase [Defluviimonas sp. 20V17]|uniref:Carboxymethylenebutenolidase n=1 Tax=Allgaiera indica TaxID=765699 RepID=A0AAN4UST2_9RHOB|nr:alpha/beta fold hydrolase [Allgaiera indica]KDB01760.1 dienelactone hydrolase [Defluviimonas sp. 20V17]GHE02537.1 dienelactone hydrolase [Allgaiera indica]SDX28266.1 carboxymethylenebutenolidase [Allgaiera indica]
MHAEDLTIVTEDGNAPARIFGEEGCPGVLFFMDIFGPRPALWDMAARIAGWGYRVLVPDLFYRSGSYGPFDAATAFGDDKTRDRLMRLRDATTQDMTARDTGAFIDALAAHGGIGPVGVVGYCMGGTRALTAARAAPVRVAVAASFHGGGLASDAPDSPHLGAAKMKAFIYVGGAGVDRSFPPEQSALLARTLREAGVEYMIENFAGMEHGWCVSDHGVYNREGAERHWRRLEQIFAERLQPTG